MAEYDNTNKGMLTKNDQGDNPKRPNMRGSLNVDGVEYWISAWTRTGGEGTKLAGEKFLSLSIERKQPRGQTEHGSAKANAYQAPQPDPFADDEIPF
jgi:hypothetical protein